jgi:hypothetical protein
MKVIISILKFAGKAILIFVSTIVIIALFAIGPINDAPLSEYPEVQSSLSKLNELQIEKTDGSGTLAAGWSAVNITPPAPIDLAGYGPRGPYKSVLDSLFARILIVDNKEKEVVMISVDLLMFPRVLRQNLEEKLANEGFGKSEIYFAATHTHHGFGNWEGSFGGQFAFGKFDEGNMDYLVDKILNGIREAQNKKSAVVVGYQKIDANELVINRLAPKTDVEDPYVRIVHLLKDTGEKGMLVSFSGHATNLDADTWELSRDYPGILIEQLENNQDIDFAMFCAGMVGSHNIDIDIPKGHERIIKTGESLARMIKAQAEQVTYDSTATMASVDLEIGLPPSQMRLTKHLRVRDWVFRSLFGPLTADIKMVRLGRILFIGMPCDYSGELSVNNQLDRYAGQHGNDLFITSFNGNYIGYITEDAHYYTCDHDEVRTMNWVGPHMGAYFTEAIKRLTEAGK